MRKREPGETNITSYNQSGGITAHTGHIHAPQPGIVTQVLFENEPADDIQGIYLTRIALEIKAPYESARSL